MKLTQARLCHPSLVILLGQAKAAYCVRLSFGNKFGAETSGDLGLITYTGTHHPALVGVRLELIVVLLEELHILGAIAAQVAEQLKQPICSTSQGRYEMGISKKQAG